MTETDYQYPDWAADVVWYQIFPDRFCRANQRNPIQASNIKGTSPWNIDESSPWQIHPWTSDWHEMQPYERANGKGLKTNILRRRYCGDINGIISKIPYLKDLGVTALYLTPIQYSPSLHKYDGTNFLHVDPFLGSNPLADIKMIESENFDDFDNACWTTADLEALKLVKTAHEAGMKVIFDGVFNHIGYNSKPFQDVLLHRQDSKYIDWFITDLQKSTPEKLVYEKFWGCVKEMPKLNYGCNTVREYVLATLKRWLKPSGDAAGYDGIDGWRLDHAIGVPLSFWKMACNFTKKINQNSLFLAELIEPESTIEPYLNNDVFDSVMNYGFYFLSTEFFAKEKKSMSAFNFDKYLRHQLSLFKPACNYLMMNLLGTHDTERLASLVVNADLKNFANIATFFANTHVEDKGYTSRRPNDVELCIQRMMIAFEFVWIGAPMIYYGDELGMWGGNDPECRKPMPWPELRFDTEHEITNGRHYKSRVSNVDADMEMLAFYKQLIKLRNQNIALRRGILRTEYADSERRVYVFSRILDDNVVIAAFNREKVSVDVSLANVPNAEYFDYNNEKSTIKANKEGVLQIKLPSIGFRILIRRS